MDLFRVFALCLLASAVSLAKPAVMGGITYNFGSGDDAITGTGISIKVLSSGEKKKPVVGAGITYYPWAKDSKKIGIDVGAGYNVSKNTAVMGGWDFLKNQPTVSLGYNKEIKSDNGKYKGIQDAVCSHGKNSSSEAK